jgi:hypothetical protein
VGVHAVAAAGLLASGLPVAVKLAGVAAALAHAVARRPAPPPSTVLCFPDGAWALPDDGGARLVLTEGTSVGPFWVSLRLASDTVSVSVLLLRDQLPAADWRALRAQVGRARSIAT